jgi:transposase-like protein
LGLTRGFGFCRPAAVLAFPPEVRRVNENAARKLIYLAIMNAVPAWTKTWNWTAALLAFKIHFGDRLPD